MTSVLLNESASVVLGFTGVGAPMNANSTFESGVSPWVGQNNGVIAQSNALVHGGGFSMRITPDGVTVGCGAISENIAVMADSIYAASAWYGVVAGAPLTRVWEVVWLDQNLSVLHTDTFTVSIPSNGVMVQVTPVMTSPDGAAWAFLRSRASGVASTVWYVDDAVLGPANGGGTAKVGPRGAREVWHPENVHVSANSGAVNEATVEVFVGDSNTLRFRDACVDGSAGDSTDRCNADNVKCGEYVWGVWINGDAGVTATLTVTGSRDV